MTGRGSSFRARLTLVIVALLVLAFGLVTALVQEVTTRRLADDFAQRFGRAVGALRELQDLRGETVARGLASLSAGNPRFRTVLSSASLPDAGSGMELADANLWMRSLLPSLPLARESDVFVVANGAGLLVFSKAEPLRVGDDLTSLDVLRRAAEEGRGSGAWGGARVPASLRFLLPGGEAAGLYQVWAEPVVYADEVHGFVVAGVRLDRAFLDRLRDLSAFELALVEGESVLASTLPVRVTDSLVEELSSGALEAGRVESLLLGGERYLLSAAEAVPGLSTGSARLVVFQNLDVEMAFLASLRATVLWLGTGVLLVAMAAALVIARGVTRPLAALGDAARALGRGELSARVRVDTGDELEQLGDAFNDMAAGLEERERIRRTFERYVTPDVARAVLERPELAAPLGDRREITVVFFDLGGYTALAESLTPEQTVVRLNEYFECVCEAVLGESGTVNQFVGDGVLAFWGAPVPDAEHALRACVAACRALESLRRLAQRWEAEGLPGLRVRVGIHTGECLVGELGAPERRSYGAVGDPMNLASRLEGVNKIYGTDVVASQAVVEAAGEGVRVRELDWIRVVGRKSAVRIYEVQGDEEPESEERRRRVNACYAAGLEAYRQRRFAESREAFEAAAALDPDDGPTRTFLRRFEDLPEGRLPEDWSPVHEAGSK